eukprot:CAMPEP_0194224698 /NCGR_PEP_ID=MMETSP0156-20130528/38005_1 /TAXON_ID=33649 /ORGANISM="Thalassionema nitzschioides, Strain L26-B" /LENGTH=281 /DNA_ID=CAMNT_0038956377 /DNA_START=112 /DNA_END=957 /DNA_ORIENTATION=-
MVSQSGVISDDDDGSCSANWNLPHEIHFSYLEYESNVVSDGEKESASGLLIVDAEQEESSNRSVTGSNSLSVPDSLPSNLFSRDRNDPHKKRFWWFVGILLLLILVVLMILTVYLILDRQELRQSQEALKTQVDNLLHETTRIKEAEAPPLLGLTAGELSEVGKNTDSKFVLADNCWLKAEIEWGECLQNAKECWSDFASQTIKTVNKFVVFDEDDDAPTILQKAGALNDVFSEATRSISKASIKITDSILELGKMVDESILTAVKQTRDAVQDASIFTRL